jgi:ATP-dependent DNA helicase RecG
MFDSQEELLGKIRLGEDSILELKAVSFRGDKITGPKRDDLADELTAFGNSFDGVLLLGVDDKIRDVEVFPWINSILSKHWYARSVVILLIPHST